MSPRSREGSVHATVSYDPYREFSGSKTRMYTVLGIVTAAGGTFLFLWYRTLVSLPVQKQPSFIHSTPFKWGIPAISAALFFAGFYLLWTISLRLAGGVLGVAVLLAFLLLKFDRYSAEMHIVYDQYLKVRTANPGMVEMAVLLHTAELRYPQWSHDRLVELVAGKDIENLILLMLINENKINPISDWELYRSLKTKAARVVRRGK